MLKAWPLNVAKCNLGKVNLETMRVSSFPSNTRGGLMLLAGAPRGLYTVLPCSSSQCHRNSLLFACQFVHWFLLACCFFLLVQRLLFEPKIVWLLVFMGRTRHRIPFCMPSRLVFHGSFQ